MDEAEKRAKAEEQAQIIVCLKPLLLQLDADFLEQALSDMIKRHKKRQSIAVLNPNPLTFNAKQNLEGAKINLLEALIKSCEAIEIVKLAEINLNTTVNHAMSLMDFFND